MPYIPISESQKEEMLRAMGEDSVEALFRDIPEKFRFPPLDLEAGKSEIEVLRELSEMAERNSDSDSFLSFLGAGAYDHFVPAAVSALAGRGEFLTAYTPYQSEVSQGTLQAIFEYQSLIANLTGMDVANAGHYDGATALAESVIIALRNGEGRRRVLLPADLHPEYRAVLDTYLAAFDPVIESYGAPAREALLSVRGNDLACLVACYPGFSGCIPDLEGASRAVHEKGGLFIIHADPIMLGLFRSPGSWGADIATAEGQSLGNELSYGGPYLGVMAVNASLMRRIPGRIAGQAFDREGRRGFVLTLTAREQHIRREKALSNICSNQGLASLRAAIYLSLMGRRGLKKAAELSWHLSHYAASRIAEIPGCTVEKKMFFKEFIVTLPLNAEELAEKLLGKKIIAGLPLSRYFPERHNELLVCVTEKKSRADIDSLVSAVRESL